MSEPSIFSRIIAGEIPATVRYEDEQFIAINDINPQAPVHVLLIPKHPYPTLENVPTSDTDFHAQLLLTGRKVAEKVGIAANYKLFMNVGKNVQEVYHVHLHILGGWKSGSGHLNLDL